MSQPQEGDHIRPEKLHKKTENGITEKVDPEGFALKPLFLLDHQQQGQDDESFKEQMVKLGRMDGLGKIREFHGKKAMGGFASAAALEKASDAADDAHHAGADRKIIEEPGERPFDCENEKKIKKKGGKKHAVIKAPHA